MTRSEGHGFPAAGYWYRVTVVFSVVVFTLFTSAVMPAQTLSVLHSFSNTPDGSQPWAGLVRDAAGHLYGTTTMGGDYGYGLVFRAVQRNSGWMLVPLYSFPPPGQGDDGAIPNAPVVIGPDGALYGTTTTGGHNQGTVFKLTPPARICAASRCPWTETILYRFTGGSDGGNPYSPVVFDGSGNLYGTTQGGGSANLGAVFELTPSGPGWTESVLYSFTGFPDGSQPETGVLLDENGNVYGTTADGGLGNSGTVFQLVPTATGWAENILYSFGPLDGYAPFGGLIFDSAGNLYGTTAYGYVGNGTVFELTPSEGQWNFTTLYYLTSGGPGVPGPVGTLLLDSSGNLYGTTFEGGLAGCGYGTGCGTVFELSPGSGGWTYNLLYQFSGQSDGGFPVDGLASDALGNLYGTGWGGGNSGSGVVFELIP
jgi:uncharacterized repeat protein (TIGR03803 family)